MTLNQFSVMGGGGEGGRRAVDNGWEGDIRFCRLYGVKLDRIKLSSLPMRLVRQHMVATWGGYM